MEANQEVLRKAERGLNEAVYTLTWAGKLWGPAGAIRVSRLRARLLAALGEEARALSALSSTYYTASGNAAVQARQASGVSRHLWWGRVIWCLCQAVLLSNRLERRVGLSGMTPDQLDVRSRILFKARHCVASLRCSREALKRDGLSVDTYALLRVGAGETLDALGQTGKAWGEYSDALFHFDQLKPTTKVRVLKSLGAHWLKVGQANEAGERLDQALALAREHKLNDQELKIQALRKQAGG